MPHKSGLADWETFDRQFRPVILRFYREHHRTPRMQELADAGHQRYISALNNHHGKYSAYLDHLGLERGRRRDAGVTTLTREQQLEKDTRFQQQLAKHFPELIRLGIAPSSGAIEAKDRKLRFSISKCRGGGYRGLCQRIGLVPFRDGRRMMNQMSAVQEAWSFLRTNNRWPRSRECGNTLHHLRFDRRSTTWYQAFGLIRITPILAAHLYEQGELHTAWLRRHDHPHLKSHLMYVRGLQRRRFPPPA